MSRSSFLKPYRCRKCSGDIFYASQLKSGRVHRACKPCHDAEQAMRHKSNSAKEKLRTLQWYYDNKKHVEGLRLELKREVFAAYGGACACCGESEYGFLSIDHVKSDGVAHRREIGGGGQNLYRWLKDHGYPCDNFRLLCMNCNWGRRFTGICPHERKEQPTC